MDYELDIKRTVELLEQTIVFEQRNIERVNEDIGNDISAIEYWHIDKIKSVGAIDAMKKERDKLLELAQT